MKKTKLRKTILMQLLLVLNVYGVAEKLVKSDPQPLETITSMLEEEIKEYYDK